MQHKNKAIQKETVMNIQPSTKTVSNKTELLTKAAEVFSRGQVDALAAQGLDFFEIKARGAYFTDDKGNVTGTRGDRKGKSRRTDRRIKRKIKKGKI